jgi:8-oxo-dGTP pyrophosphatase MutT (NUDIX family)
VSTVIENAFQRHLVTIQRLRDRYRHSPPDQPEVDDLAADWAWAADKSEAELLAVCRLDGRLTRAAAPRWLAHLLGIPHATAHVGLATPSGMVVLQLRSAWKAQFPNAWDMAVTGHVTVPAATPGAPVCMEEAAARELEEELGLPTARLGEWLQSPRLQPVGTPRASFSESHEAPRPWCDVEVRHLYGGILTPTGVAALSYQESELAGILLCRPADALALLRGPNAAAGALDSLRDFIAWLRAQGLAG